MMETLALIAYRQPISLVEIRDLDQYNPELALVDTGEISDTTSSTED